MLTHSFFYNNAHINICTSACTVTKLDSMKKNKIIHWTSPVRFRSQAYLTSLFVFPILSRVNTVAFAKQYLCTIGLYQNHFLITYPHAYICCLSNKNKTNKKTLKHTCKHLEWWTHAIHVKCQVNCVGCFCHGNKNNNKKTPTHLQSQDKETWTFDKSQHGKSSRRRDVIETKWHMQKENLAVGKKMSSRMKWIVQVWEWRCLCSLIFCLFFV